MVFFILFFFRLEIPFFSYLSQKIKICQFKLKFGTYNHVHNILRLFDGGANFPFTTSELNRDYY